MKNIALASLIALLPMSAVAQDGRGSVCNNTKALLNELQSDFGEKVVFTGRSDHGVTVMFAVNDKTKSWTEISSVEGEYDMVCVVDFGSRYDTK